MRLEQEVKPFCPEIFLRICHEDDSSVCFCLPGSPQNRLIIGAACLSVGGIESAFVVEHFILLGVSLPRFQQLRHLLPILI